MALRNRNRRYRWLFLAFPALLAAGAALFYGPPHGPKVLAAQTEEAPRAAGEPRSTTLGDQTDLAVTVYNSNIALVRDVRQLSLPPGMFRLKFMDIAATGKQLMLSGILIDRIVGGKIVEEREEWDALGMMRQLGVVPAAKVEAKVAA